MGPNANLGGGDPLYGDVPKGSTPPGTPSSGNNKSSSVPPLPTSNSASSTASLANQTKLQGGRPLGINDGSNAGQSSGWQRTGIGLGMPEPQSNANPPRSTNPTVVPLPRDGAPPANLLQTNGAWSPSGIAASAQNVANNVQTVANNLNTLLQARGAVGIKREPVAGGVRFSCYVPARANPANLRYYEAVGADEESALRAVVQQIQQDVN
jgi:hypothetical protein